MTDLTWACMTLYSVVNSGFGWLVLKNSRPMAGEGAFPGKLREEKLLRTVGSRSEVSCLVEQRIYAVLRVLIITHEMV